MFNIRKPRLQLWPDILWALLGLAALVIWFLSGTPTRLLSSAFSAPSLAQSAYNLGIGENGTVTGKVEPNAFVCMLDEKGARVAEGYAGPDGSFSLALPAKSAAGDYKYSLVSASDGSATLFSGVSAASPLALAVAAPAAVAQVEPTATVAPTEAPAATATAEPTKAPAATATTAPTEAPKATDVPKATNTPAPSATPKPVGPTIGGIAAGSVLLASSVNELAGTAAPNAEVQVFDGDKLIGTVKADADGKWTLALPKGLSLGAHSFSASTAEGKAEAVGLLAVAAPVIAQPRGARPATELLLTGNATSGATVVVTAGDKQVCSVAADARGRWTCNLPADLAADKQSLKVSVVDAGAKPVVEGNTVEVDFSILLPVTGEK